MTLSSSIFAGARGRHIGAEAGKTLEAKLADGFFGRYMSGANVLDIGYRGYSDNVEPVLPHAKGIELDDPGYDGRTLPFPDGSQDAVYNSHCLEHISDYRQAIQEWFRVIKTGGYLIVVVPHKFIYEKREDLPSRWNEDHKRFYTPANLIGEVEESLPPNSYRLRHLIDNDARYDYSIGPERHAEGCYEIEMVIEKIARPAWQLERSPVTLPAIVLLPVPAPVIVVPPEPAPVIVVPPEPPPASAVPPESALHRAVFSVVDVVRPAVRPLPEFVKRPLRNALRLIVRRH